MSKVLFSTWQGEFIDNRNTPVDEWKESSFKVPATYQNDINSKIFIGWNGLVVFEEGVDVVKAGAEYAAQYHIY